MPQPNKPSATGTGAQQPHIANNLGAAEPLAAAPFDFTDHSDDIIPAADAATTGQGGVITGQPSATTPAGDGTLGLTPQEVKDVNAITVTISDPDTPVVVFFGARESGKTMTLIRLTRYLKSRGYKVVPDVNFRPGSDVHYQRMCNEFHNLVASDNAALGTTPLSFMLLKVIAPNGRSVCQLLEAPGEHYFDQRDPNSPFPAYIQSVCQLPNRITWIFIVEENWGGSQNVRDQYVDKIQSMLSAIRSRDRIIFTCHKVDLTPHRRQDGQPDERQVFRNIENQYPHIFDRYVNRNPITRWFAPYRFDFLTFSAGSFPQLGNGKLRFIQGDDVYPSRLWSAIKKNV